MASGDVDQARELLGSYLQRVPGDADIAKQLARLLLDRDASAAASALAVPARVWPRDAELRFLQGEALAKIGDFAGARDAYAASVQAGPSEPLATGGLARCLLELGDAAGALAACEACLRLNPVHPDAYRVHAGVLVRLLRQREGLDVAMKGLDACGEDPLLLEAAVYAMNVADGIKADQCRRLHERLARAAAPGPSRSPESFARVRDPHRQLRVGFLSTDFRNHACASFLEGPIAELDRARITPILFGTSPIVDAITERFRAMATLRDVSHLAPQALAATIDAEAIDVLIDLGGWTSRDQMRALATRLAPIQLTYLGYPNTTALGAMDGRIVDSITDPREADAHCTEPLIRVNRCFLAYRADPRWTTPETAQRSEGDALTLGSFNDVKKLSAAALSCWARILRAVPGARLLIKSMDMPGSVAAEVRGRFANEGVAPERVELVGFVARQADHFAMYQRIDLALDSFPYNGTTTTCEALSQGVPVLTLLGDQHRSRVSASILHAVGLPDLIAISEDDFVAKGIALATDGTRLRMLRAEMPHRLAHATLSDAAGLARALEDAIRERWIAFCAAAR